MVVERCAAAAAYFRCGVMRNDRGASCVCCEGLHAFEHCMIKHRHVASLARRCCCWVGWMWSVMGMLWQGVYICEDVLLLPL